MKTRSILLAAVLMFCNACASAADRVVYWPLAEALNNADVREVLEEAGVKLYFGKQRPDRKIEEDIKTDSYFRPNNAFLKSDRRSCFNAFLSAITAMTRDASAFGANAIVDIHSVRDDKEFVSETEYECHGGVFSSNVQFTVHFVKLAP